jgi:dihydroorotate dehydrogenase electron transfer subunit
MPLPATWTGRPPRYELEARIVAHEQILANEYEMVCYAPPIARSAQPGQFLELLFGANYAPLVRRPFSLYRVDRGAGTCSILYRTRGTFTVGLAQKQVGDSLSMLGPLGKPFTWSSAPGTRHILIAGGVGAPPLYFLAREIRLDLIERGDADSSVIVINGARTKDLLVGLREFGDLDVELFITTDDGSHGQRGLTTELLTALLDAGNESNTPPATQIYTCGPAPMLRAVAQVALARALPCQVSVETSMPCGIGTCQGCAIPIRDEAAPDGCAYALACWDGPVFEACDLLWEL